MKDNREELINRITFDSGIMTGKPVIRGTRLTVEHILKALASGQSYEELHQEYPFLEKEDVEACLLYAARLIEDEKVYISKSA